MKGIDNMNKLAIIMFLLMAGCSERYLRIEAVNQQCEDTMTEWCKAQYRIISGQTTTCAKDYDCDKFGFVCRYGACLRE